MKVGTEPQIHDIRLGSRCGLQTWLFAVGLKRKEGLASL
jgi:hypothetical protein